MCCEAWTTGSELVALFGLTEQAAGVRDFVALIEIGGELLQFPEFGLGTYAVAGELMRAAAISPLVFWTRVKRQCAPLMEAQGDTLEALGLHLPEGKRTAYAVADAAAKRRAAMGGGSREYAAKYAAVIAAGKRQQGRGKALKR